MDQNKQTFSAGTIIFREGVYENFLYEILSGQVSIYASYSEPGEKRLVTLTVGQTFGEMAMVDCMPRSATAVAETDVELFKVDDTMLEQYLSNNPERFLSMMQHLSDRTRILTEDYRLACETASEMLWTIREKQEKSTGLIARIRRFAREWERSLNSIPPEQLNDLFRRPPYLL